MSKLGILLIATAACTLLPSASMAACLQQGTIVRTFIGTASPNARVSVRNNSPGSTTYFFVTSNAQFINAAVVALASHVSVQVTGDAVTCPAPNSGERNGGTMTSIYVTP